MSESQNTSRMLSADAVRAIADLARLELSEDEIELYSGQLSDILGYFQRLQELDTSQIPPTASVLPLSNVLREDRASAPLTPEQVIANAPQSEANQFRVNAVLDSE